MEAERKTKVNHSNICTSIKNNRTAGGFLWGYKETPITRLPEPKKTTKEKPVWVYIIEDGRLYGHYTSQKATADSLGVKECSISKNLTGYTKSLIIKVDGVKVKCKCRSQPETNSELTEKQRSADSIEVTKSESKIKTKVKESISEQFKSTKKSIIPKTETSPMTVLLKNIAVR